jgi:hypothetical protein
MEILAVELKSGVASNNFVAFVEQSVSGRRAWTAQGGWSSLKLLRAGIKPLRQEQCVFVVEGFFFDSSVEGLTEFCEVFYNLDCGQWFAWPTSSAAAS